MKHSFYNRTIADEHHANLELNILCNLTLKSPLTKERKNASENRQELTDKRRKKTFVTPNSMGFV